ncbi:MAG TPA: glycerate kinase [Firmicutes bacterium]|jgi:glycerate kinase|nr:glycerate kinase [Bacillota bacterium]HHT42750.1 glycerate kinase [Bacillota bacterium]
MESRTQIVIAPDSFKGSLGSTEAAKAMARGVQRVLPEAELTLLPLSDGGEGLVESLVVASGGRLLEYEVTGPLGTPVQAQLGLMGDGQTAVIEMAQASGLVLVPDEERNPLLTTTFGTGELISKALDLGCTHLIIGIGGSATNDGGMGMAQALGVRFLDADGELLGSGGGELARLESIDCSRLDPRLEDVRIEVACDVNNPLTGPQGAAHVYGPQKGATPEMVEFLDQGLARYDRILQRDLGQDVGRVPGAGAAGGLGAGLMAILKGKLVSGIELVLNVLEFDEKVRGADLVITGEGKFDAQSAYGKVPMGVAQRSRAFGVPVVVIAGTVLPSAEVLHQEGVSAYFSILNRPMTLKEAMEGAGELLENQTAEVIRLFRIKNKE